MINFGVFQILFLPIIESQFKPGLFSIKSSARDNFVVLTIDDGLSTRSQEMLDLLAKYDAKATFFIHKNNTIEVPNYQEIISTMINQGHDIGNHTTADIPSRSLPSEDFSNTFVNADRFLQDLDIRPRFFRAAGGFYNSSVMMPWLLRYDYESKFIMGSFLPWDTFLPFPHLYAKQLIEHIFPGAIVVFHDGTQKGEGRLNRTFIALEKFLQGMKKKQYQVISLDDAFNIEN